MLYFKQATLFSIHIRFVHQANAITAQKWMLNHVHYAIHVRRNNQGVALENAIVLAKLLNRTLVVHPMAPHHKGALFKAGAQPGYIAYNRLSQSDLVPLSVFLDLKLLSQLIPVQEVVTSHHQFYHDFGQLSWRNICHSMGFGYWMDQRPSTIEEVTMCKRQHFHASNAWKKKCPYDHNTV